MFVEDLNLPALDDEDRHHLERVLRLRPGEMVTASDGRGAWRSCEYAGAERLAPTGSIIHQVASVPPVTIGFALTKGVRPEWTVQKLTEVGVDHIVPITTARTVVRWEGRKESRQLGRIRAIARSAAMQSRRVWLPLVAPVQRFTEVHASLGERVALAQAGGAPPDLDLPAVLIGPEGGWDDAELSAGLPLVGLGPTVLRAETAALAVGVLLCALRERIAAPAPKK